jgi:sarcosine oxidase, subunit beta
MLPAHAEVAIIGGGVMGLSTAYHLARAGVRDVLLLERAEVFGLGATGKCAGGFRHQFATEINIRLSIESVRLLDNFEDEPGYPVSIKRCGYLFVLTRPDHVAAFRAPVGLQHRLGVMTEWLGPDEVRERLPLLVLDDVLAGTFYAGDGLADPSGVVAGYAAGARRLGATLLTDVEVIGAHVTGEAVRSLQTSRGSVEVGAVVNAAGPFAADVGRFFGVDVPVEPLKRQMLVTTPLPDVSPDFPFVIDFASSLYFHREGAGLLTGMSRPDQAPGPDESVDLEWEQVHLAAAIRRLPLLASAGLASHWAGLYEMTPDAHPLIGRLAPLTNAYVVAGFSGHGFMHGPIAGRLLAEVILDGRAHTLDITELDPARFGTGRLVREYNVI